MKAVADTGPLVAAINRQDDAHALASTLVTLLGRDLVVMDTVVVEADHLIRACVGSYAAHAFLQALIDGEHMVGYLTPGLLRRAVELDRRYADLALGITDGSVMAYAEQHDLPVLTFDFEHFRATAPRSGYWRLVVDEAKYLEATG
jgi:predicted nucleic acid-binding protein